MRLDAEEKFALNEALKDINDEVYLFGSRVEDTANGGDIDLLIFSEESAFHLSQNVTVGFFENCEEKIDVIVMNPKKLTLEQKAFLKTIKMERIR